MAPRALVFGGQCLWGPLPHHAKHSAVTDQLSSDLASLRIDRDTRSGGGSLRRVLVVVVVVGAVAAAGWTVYPRIRGEVFKTEVAATEVTLISPVQSSVQVT